MLPDTNLNHYAVKTYNYRLLRSIKIGLPSYNIVLKNPDTCVKLPETHVAPIALPHIIYKNLFCKQKLASQFVHSVDEYQKFILVKIITFFTHKWEPDIKISCSKFRTIIMINWTKSHFLFAVVKIFFREIIFIYRYDIMLVF